MEFEDKMEAFSLMMRFHPFFGIGIVLLISLWAVRSFFLPGFFPMHDNTQVARVFEMAKSLKDGMFPVRWVSDLGFGYGYPIFNFYAPLAYYVGGLLVILGIDALFATKLVMVTGVLLAGGTMYFLAKSFFGERGGILAALFYVYAPYHALDIYVRGDVSEIWAYGFLPLIFFGLWRAYQATKWRYVLIGAVAYAGVILSHNLTALMATPFVLFTGIFLIATRYKVYKFRDISTQGAIFLFGILFSAFYWLPVFFEMSYTNVLSQIGGAADFRNHFVCLSQLWGSPWGFAGSAPGCIDGMSFKVGKFHIIFSFIALVLSIVFYKKVERRYVTHACIAVWIASAGLLLSLFLTLEVAKPFWEVFEGIMAFFQYPWRFLLLAAFFTSFLSGYLFWLLDIFLGSHKYYFLRSTFFLLFSVGILIFFYSGIFYPQTIFQARAEDFTEVGHISFAVSKISNEYMPQNFIPPASQKDLPQQRFRVKGTSDATVHLVAQKTQYLAAVITSNADANVEVAIAYFPSWQFYRDGNRVTTEVENGRYVITMPKGSHTIEARFENTLAQTIGNSITIISICALIAGIIYHEKKI